jgi:hypothetical protein
VYRGLGDVFKSPFLVASAEEKVRGNLPVSPFAPSPAHGRKACP